MKSAPIKCQASGDYIYSQNLVYEEKFGKIEQIASKVYDQIIADNNYELSEEDREYFYAFVMMQQGRTKLVAEDRAEVRDRSMKVQLLPKMPEFLRKNLDAIRIQSKEPVLDSVMFNLQNLDLCYDLKWKLLINQSCMSFIASDNPVSTYNQFYERLNRFSVGLGSRGLQMYMPLTSKIAVFFYDSYVYKIGNRKQRNIVITDKNDILALNRLTALNADKILIFNSSELSAEDLDNMLTDLPKKLTSEQKVETKAVVSEQSSLIINRNRINMCHLKLSFIKELDRVKFIKEFDSSPFNLKCRYDYREK